MSDDLFNHEAHITDSFAEHVQRLEEIKAGGWNCTPQQLRGVVIDVQSSAIRWSDVDPLVQKAVELLQEATGIFTERAAQRGEGVPAELNIVQRTIDFLNDKIQFPCTRNEELRGERGTGYAH